MVESEKNRQRKIGKQLMIVRMVHYANDTAATYLTRKNICNWAEMTEEEFTDLFDAIYELDCIDKTKGFENDDYIMKIIKVLDRGYDWDVIQKMLREGEKNNFAEVKNYIEQYKLRHI